MSVSLRGGVLVVTGTDEADSIRVEQRVDLANGLPPSLFVRGDVPGNQERPAIPSADVRRIVIRTGGGDDSVDVSTQHYTFQIAPGVTLDGAPGDDAVTYGAAARNADPANRGELVQFAFRIDLGAGNDFAAGGGADDVILGGAGDDRVIDISGRDVLAGGAGDDRLVGGDGDDILTGGTGNDEINGGPGNDTLLGGAGNDVLGAIDSVTARGAFEVEPGDDLLTGGGGDDDLRGGDGADTLLGNAGRDSVSGMGGADRLRGGAGPDRFYNFEAEAERLDFAPGVDELRGLPSLDALDDVSIQVGATRPAVTIDVLANDAGDEDPAGGTPLTITAVSDPPNGTATIVSLPLFGGGSRPAILYTADPGFSGTDTFTYTISNGNGGTDMAAVTVTIPPIPPDPNYIGEDAP